MAVRKAPRATAKELAATKAQLEKIKAAKKAEASSPKSAVKVTKPFKGNVNKTLNMLENSRVGSQAASAWAERIRQEKLQEVRASVQKPKVVKINSANPTRQGTTPAIRRAGGLMGGGAGGNNWRLNK